MSQPSTHIDFYLENSRLYDDLKTCGFRFKHVSKGTLDDEMTVILPSGNVAEYRIEDSGDPTLELLNPEQFRSVSAWAMHYCCYAYDGFLSALEKSGFISENDRTGTKSLEEELENAFSSYDGEIEEASVSYEHYEDGTCEIVHDDIIQGKRRTMSGYGYGSFYDSEGEDDENLNREYSLWKDGHWQTDLAPDDSLWDDEDEEDGTAGEEEIEDKTFVVTGKLQYFESRNELVEFIEDWGGIVTSSVSSKTDYLICNDTASTSSKMKKAKELGIPVITEREFIERFGDPDEYDLDEEENEDENSPDFSSYNPEESMRAFMIASEMASRNGKKMSDLLTYRFKLIRDGVVPADMDPMKFTLYAYKNGLLEEAFGINGDDKN